MVRWREESGDELPYVKEDATLEENVAVLRRHVQEARRASERRLTRAQQARSSLHKMHKALGKQARVVEYQGWYLEELKLLLEAVGLYLNDIIPEEELRRSYERVQSWRADNKMRKPIVGREKPADP